jgi:glutaminyl-tRNA synthetase
MENLNPNSLEVVQDARVELNMREVRPGDKFQFERLGYFCVDLDSTPDRLVFNRTVSLKDSWAKMQKK